MMRSLMALGLTSSKWLRLYACITSTAFHHLLDSETGKSEFSDSETDNLHLLNSETAVSLFSDFETFNLQHLLGGETSICLPFGSRETFENFSRKTYIDEVLDGLELTLP